jgi:hypothetical protein
MPGNPHSGSKVRDPLDWEVTEPGENRGKVIAHRDLQSKAAIDDRENRRNFPFRLCAAHVQPILSTKSYRSCSMSPSNVMAIRDDTRSRTS